MAIADVVDTVEVFSPVAHRLEVRRTVNRLSRLDGATVGLLCNSKPNAQVLLDAVAEGIQKIVPTVTIVREAKDLPTRAAPDAVYTRLVGRCDAVIFASADCGSCTSWGIHDVAELEKRGLPSLCLVAHPFVPMANAQSVALEYPDLRRVVFEGPIAGIAEADVRAKGRGIAADVVATLTARTRPR